MNIGKFTVDENGRIFINECFIPLSVNDYTIRPKKGGGGKLKEVTLTFTADVEVKFTEKNNWK